MNLWGIKSNFAYESIWTKNPIHGAYVTELGYREKFANDKPGDTI